MRYLFILFVFLLPGAVSAAEITVTPSVHSLGAGESYLAQVSLHTEGAMVNAIEGEIMIPRGLSVTDIRLSRSIVPYWIQTPKEVSPGVISFAGMLPGGYQNGARAAESEGNLFTLALTAEQTGEAVIRINPSTVAYLNDGEGTSLTLRTQEALVTVTKEGTGTSVTAESDDVPPESFEVERVEGRYIGEEGAVLVFNAIDKDSGIAGYEMARSLIWLPEFLRSYEEVSSPARLRDSDTFGIVWVRAHDRYDNQTVTQFTPSGMWGYIPSLIVVILIFVLITILILRKKDMITS